MKIEIEAHANRVWVVLICDMNGSIPGTVEYIANELLKNGPLKVRREHFHDGRLRKEALKDWLPMLIDLCGCHVLSPALVPARFKYAVR